MQPYASSTTARKQSSKFENMGITHLKPYNSSTSIECRSPQSEEVDVDRLQTCNLSKTTLKGKEIRDKKTKVRLLNDIYDATKDEMLEKSTYHFVTETESDISIFAAIIEGDNYDTASILTFKQALKSKEKENWLRLLNLNSRHSKRITRGH